MSNALRFVLLGLLALNLAGGDFLIDDGTVDLLKVLANPAYINAHRMALLLKRQDVVSTCRYMLFKAHKTFYDAEASCKAMGDSWNITTRGDVTLADVYDKEENFDIASLIHLAFGMNHVGGKYNRSNWAWVNMRKVHNNDRVLDKSERGKYWNASDWQWGNGSNPTWSNWQKNMPDQQTKKIKVEVDGKIKKVRVYQNFVQISRYGKWDDTYESMEAPYVCNYCGKYIVVASQVKWTKAQELCASYGLTLALVNSAEDNADLFRAMNATLGPDTATPRFNNMNWVWIGVEEVMHVNGTGTGQWINHDNTTLGWDPVWDFKRQPDNWEIYQKEQKVVAVSRFNGLWDDSFVHRKRPFACMCPYKTCEY